MLIRKMEIHDLYACILRTYMENNNTLYRLNIDHYMEQYYIIMYKVYIIILVQ